MVHTRPDLGQPVPLGQHHRIDRDVALTGGRTQAEQGCTSAYVEIKITDETACQP